MFFLQVLCQKLTDIFLYYSWLVVSLLSLCKYFGWISWLCEHIINFINWFVKNWSNRKHTSRSNINTELTISLCKLMKEYNCNCYTVLLKRKSYLTRFILLCVSKNGTTISFLSKRNYSLVFFFFLLLPICYFRLQEAWSA